MASVDIAAVLEYYGGSVPQVQYGWATMKCPFHRDSEASARVNRDHKRFRCFVCDINGDGFSVVMDREGVDFVSAIEFITGTVGASVEGLRERNTGSREVPRAAGDNPRQRSLFPSRGRYKPRSGA